MPINAALDFFEAMDLISATEEDSRLLTSLNQEMIEASGHNPGLNVDGLYERMLTWLRSGDYEGVIFKQGDEHLGYALFNVAVKIVHLRQFFICARYRRQGLGREAIHRLVKEYWHTAQKVYLDVNPTNQTAICFWLALGFEGNPDCMTLLFEPNISSDTDAKVRRSM